MLDISRYERNIIIDKIGTNGQIKLANSNILIVGVGGLGSSALFYLAANGVGNITIIDHDKVELSNLQRQIIHNESDINRYKVESAKNKISLFNSKTSITSMAIKANKANLNKIITQYDIIIDCSDNFATRFDINESCCINNKKLVSAAVKEFSGQLAIFNCNANNPCYNCFNEDNRVKRAKVKLKDKGILGSIPGILGSMQATVAINEILAINDFRPNQLLLCNFLNFSFKIVKISKNPYCKICANL